MVFVMFRMISGSHSCNASNPGEKIIPLYDKLSLSSKVQQEINF
jgi:hypothetical protein